MSDAGDARFSGLLDAEARHRADPQSFSIPRSDVRRSLAGGSIAKLLFGFGGGERPPAERMWVEVVEAVDGRYVGRLLNTPEVISDLSPGALVDFGPEHVAANWDETVPVPSAAQLAVVSDRVWREGSIPVRARRLALPDPQFSGWFLFAEDDVLVPPDDLDGFGPISHGELTERYRAFDSIESEPAGSRWRWDSVALEWVLDTS